VFSRLLCILLFGLPLFAMGKTVTYEFDISAQRVNKTGVAVEALTIAGQIPAPEIAAEVGDLLVVTFHNQLDVLASVHWHGVILPGIQDGVAYLNTQPIAPHGSHTFEFPVLHKGTFWYHSHSDLQIQRGVYGPIVFREPATSGASERPELQELTVLFSDWTNEDPTAVLGNLKRDEDFYAFKKDAVQSWDRVLEHGLDGVMRRLGQSLQRMPPMDLADVGYDAFLVNGQRRASAPALAPGAEQVKLRLINGSTSSYFDVEYAGGPMQIVAADGQDVEPFLVQRLQIATAETYDVLVPVDADYAYELRATSIDGSGHSSLLVGAGTPVSAPDVPAPDLLQMDHAGMQATDGVAMDHSPHAPMNAMPEPDAHAGHTPAAAHDGHPMPASSGMPGQGAMATASPPVVAHMTDYRYLVATTETRLDPNRPWREISLRLTGNMNNYLWSFNDKTQRQDPQILIRKGENVRFEFTNETMMHHPLHFHGHFFRVVNEQGDRSPLKHTVDVQPMGSVVIEFAADEEKDWLFHCHNQYHMKTGMNRVVSYADSSTFDDSMATAILPHFRWFDRSRINATGNFLALDYSLFEERHDFELRLDSNFDEIHEAKAKYLFHFNRFFSAFAGVENMARENEREETLAIAGINYQLPLLVESEWRVDEAGDFRLELESELQLSRRFAFDWRWNTDNEYRYRLQYSLNKRWAITANTDSEYGTGVGLQAQF
jgi:FtsP/CotA-like multicopper oxidase with cupredoxin domain